MLTNKEIKMIRRYAAFPVVGIVALLMCFALCGVWLVLVMVDDLVFHTPDFYTAGSIVFIALVAILLFIFCYTFLAARFGQNGKKWRGMTARLHARQQEIDHTAESGAVIGTMAAGHLMRDFGGERMQQLGEGMEIAAGVGATALAGKESLEMYSNARSVADAAGITLPKVGKYVILTILIPLVIMVGVYIPEYMHASAATSATQTEAAAAIDDIKGCLDPVCQKVYADDPMEEYSESGYTIQGYLDDEMGKYIYIKVDQHGVITQLSYDYKINMDAGTDENLAGCQEAFDTLHEAIAKTSAEFENADMPGVEPLTEEFEETFRSGSYYDSIELSEDLSGESKVYREFQTKTKEEFNEYTEPKIAVFVYGDI